MSSKDIPYLKAVELEYAKLAKFDRFELISFPEKVTHLLSVDGIEIEVRIKRKCISEEIHEFFIWSRRKGFLGFGSMCISAFRLTGENAREGFPVYDFKDFD